MLDLLEKSFYQSTVNLAYYPIFIISANILIGFIKRHFLRKTNV